MAQGRVAVFDAHLHIIDPRFPLVASRGYVPEPFTVDDYRAATAGMNVVGGAVVAGSFQGGQTPWSWLPAALARLGPGFVGVAQPSRTSATRTSSRSTPPACGRCGSTSTAAVRWTRRWRTVCELAGWHAEVYASDLPAHEARLRTLPRLVVDHMGMNPEGLAAAVRLGAVVKATPRFEGDLRAVPPDKLLFGTDLPGTRARRRFASADLERVAAIAPAALADNARAWYRPRA